MKPPHNLLDLGDDILRLIFEEVGNRWLLISLAKVSKQCYSIACPIIWHSVTLSESSYMVERRLKIAEILLNENYSANKFLREIRVTGISRRVKGVDSMTLEKILDGLTALRSFRQVHLNTSCPLYCDFRLTTYSWETPRMIPDKVLTKLNECWPDASIHVVHKHYRTMEEPASWDITDTGQKDWDPGNLTAITDRPLLSSPMLSSLEYLINWTSEGRNLFSELDTVCDILARSPRLENLDIGFHCRLDPTQELNPCMLSSELMDMKIDTQTSRYELAISLPTDFQLPQLTELTDPIDYGIGAETGDVKTLSVMLFSQISRWKAPIKTLILRRLSPYLPFEQLEGRTPNLRNLHVILYAYGGFDNYWPALSFIGSLNSLQKLKIQNKTTTTGGIGSAILKLKHSLRKLHVCTGVRHSFLRDPHPLLAEQDFAALPSLSTLREMEIDIDLPDAEAFISFGYGKDNDIHNLTERGRTLIRMGKLENLTLNVYISDEECKFTNDSIRSADMPSLRKSAIRAAALGLFDQILAQNPLCTMRTIEIKFNSRGTDECDEDRVYTISARASKADEDMMKRMTEKVKAVEILTGAESGIAFHVHTDSGHYCDWELCE